MMLERIIFEVFGISLDVLCVLSGMEAAMELFYGAEANIFWGILPCVIFASTSWYENL